MPNPKHCPRRSSKAHLWAKRTVHLKTYLQDLPRRLRLDIEALVKIFLTRRSLLLKLADNYLIELRGHISRATVQRTLQQLGLLKRITGPPKRQADGSWKQDRKLILLLPKKDPAEYSYLVSHSGQQPELEGKPLAKNSTQSVKQRSFVDYLYGQKSVSKSAWAYFLRTQGAEPRTFGYLLSSIHQKIQHRPDVLESILFDAEAQKLRGRQLVGYVVSEVKARI